MDDIESSTKIQQAGDQASRAPSPVLGTVLQQHHGFTLIPQPSDDPRDPLNWPMSKKTIIVAVLCLSTFAGLAGSLSGQLQVMPQAKLYHKTPTEIAYQSSVANAGVIVGAFFWFPVSHVIGRSSAIFWSLLGSMGCQIWSAVMTHPDNYIPWIVSRIFAGFFGVVTCILGPSMLVDLFFLHQRGRAFTVFHWWFDFGSVAGPTIGGLIGSRTSWVNAYWFTATLSGVTVIPAFLFLQETSWNRTADASHPIPPTGFVANRIATLLPGTQLMPKRSIPQIAKIAATPFIIGAAPVTLILGTFSLISFGFYVAMNAITPVWIQKPVSLQGYGFSAFENACFSLFHWAGIIIALVYGQLLSDSLPLYIAKRNGGFWKPEYRLHALWVPALICNPIGLGIFGAALQYHLSWGFLALAQVLVTFGSLSATPLTVNYICECFTKNPIEVSMILNTFRIGFGLSVAFYINPWVEKMGFGWAYGTMSLLQVFSFSFVILLIWKGHQFRELSFGGFASSEEGEIVIENAGTDHDKNAA